MDKIPIPDYIMIEDLKKDYGCPICHEILTNVVVPECCGIQMCRYCFMTSVKKNPKCQSCLEKCKTALDFPKVDRIEAVLSMEELEMFLKNRKLHEIFFDLDEEFDNLNQEEEEALAAMSADNEAAKNELIPCDSKSEKKLLSLKKLNRQILQRRFRRGNVQRNPFKKPLAINSTGSIRRDFLVRKEFMAQHGFKPPAKMDNSASAYAILSLYAKPNSVTSASSLATPKGQTEFTQVELKVEHERNMASIKEKQSVEAKKRLGFGIGLGDRSLDASESKSHDRESITELLSRIKEMQSLIEDKLSELEEESDAQKYAANQFSEMMKNLDWEKMYMSVIEDTDDEDGQSDTVLAETTENFTSDEESESMDDKDVETEPVMVEMVTDLNWEYDCRSRNDDSDEEEDAQSENELAGTMNILISEIEYESNTHNDAKTDAQLAEMMGKLSFH